MTEVRAIILVVDDEESVRTVLRRALESAGYHVLTAESGQMALDVMSQGKVEVMLLDVSMPGLSGLDVLTQVRARWPEISVIMVTGVADLATGVNAIKEGAYDYVAKPFDLDAIATVVRRARERRNLVSSEQRLAPAKRKETPSEPLPHHLDIFWQTVF